MTATVRVGDWVSGVSQMDEKFIGYVDSMHGGQAAKIWVAQCDRSETVGTFVETALARVKKLPDYTPSTTEDLRSLIELALMTRDREWFDSLSARLAIAAASGEGAETLSHDGHPVRSRRSGFVPKRSDRRLNRG